MAGTMFTVKKPVDLLPFASVALQIQRGSVPRPGPHFLFSAKHSTVVSKVAQGPLRWVVSMDPP